MSFDFDKLTDRRSTGSLKYDFAVPRGRPKDVLPLWVNEVTRAGYSQVPGLGLIACQAAYAGGEAWLEELKAYLVSNLDYLRNADLPGIRLVEPEGTYLCWLDCSGLGLSAKELEDLVLYKANLWLDGGRMFGEASAQFQRVNIACPIATLQQAVSQLQQAICTLK